MSYTPISGPWLRDNGYEGLVAPGECGCRLDDLRPCGNDPVHVDEDCLPAYERNADCAECQRCNAADDGGMWCMTADKPRSLSSTEASRHHGLSSIEREVGR